MRDIIQYPASVLAKPTNTVTDFSPIPALATEMFAAMVENHGMGLAANQIADNRRVAVMHVPGWQPMVLVNPRITRSIGEGSREEGCLSVERSKKRVTVRRAKIVHVEYQDEHGVPKKLKAHDLLARCIQHEIDHLDGMTCLERSRLSLAL